MFSRIPFIVIASAFAFAARTQAQSVVLKDGTRIPADELVLGDGKISRNVTLSNGVKAQASVPFSEIQQMDWPNPKQLVDARKLMAEGKTKEAIAIFQQARDYFRQFKDIKGNPYQDAVFAYVEALDAVGDFDAILKVMPEINGIKWDDEKKTALRIVKLNMERRTSSDQESILKQAEGILEDADDTAVRAKLSMTIGDIHFKKERWEQAFDAYLRVPVFYASQTAIVPQAELMAARCLVKLERYKDAASMFDRISASYPGSEVGEAAKKEFLTSTGRENKPDKIPQSGNDSTKKTEDKAKS